MELKSYFAQDTQGNVIPSPVAYVYLPGTTTLVTGLLDKNGAALSNPFTGTVQGLVQFQAADGEYDLRVTGAARDYTLRVRFLDASPGGALAIRADLASTAAGKGGALVGNAPYSAPMIGAIGDNTANDATAISAYLASYKRLHFPRRIGANASSRYGLSSSILITQNGTHLSFDEGAALVPYGGAGPARMIDISGSAPTSWTALSADSYANACVIQTATDPGWQVGDWLEIRSNKIIDSTPNIFGDAVGDCHKIAQKFGSGPCWFVFKEPLCDDFFVSDSAVAGKATILENIVIENPQFNDENFANTIGFSIRAQYCAGLKIIRPKAFGSKTPFAADNAAGDFIKLINCIEPYIEDPCMTHGAYYGLSILGWTRGLKSYGGTMTELRHAVSLVHQSTAVIGTPGRVQGYGQPSDILIHGMTARNTSLSSFDTHDTGVNTRFVGCSAYGSGDDGFQFRTHKVKAIDCVANGALRDGFAVDDMVVSSTPGTKYGAQDCELVNCRALNNGRMGANLRYNRAVVRGGEYIKNGSTKSRPAMVYPPTSAPAGQGVVQAGACGIRINGGIIDGVSIQDNAGSDGANGSAIIYGDFAASGASAQVSMRPLEVRGITAPANARQTSFISLGDPSLDFGLITLGGGNQIDGYGNSLFNNLGTIDNKPPMSVGGNHITTDATKRRGQATLVGGSVFVANTAVRNKPAAAFGEAIVSKIALTRTDLQGLPGSLYIKSITDGVGFTVASTAYSEPTRTNVIRNNTNVGVTNGVIGSGGVLPTNWTATLGAASGIALQVVGTGTETGPLGGTQNYIDIRFSGTASAALNYGIYLDSVTNPAAAAVLGETWTASLGAMLTAGSLANVTSINIGVFERTSGGAGLASSAASIAPTSTKKKVVHTRTLTGATTAFVAAYINIIANSGAVIDVTVRFYMPQMEKAADASAPIATSGGAVTRTVDTNAADNSTFEWVASL